MAREVCKIIINNGLQALARSVEKSLVTPGIYKGRIDEEKRLDLLQRMADIDLAAYYGGEVPLGGYSGIMIELEACGLVTAEVWKLYARPTMKGPT